MGNSIIVSTGSLYEQATDYEDADKRLTISRTYRSMPGSDVGSFPVLPIPFGLGDLWRLNFQWDLELGSYFPYVGNFGISTPDGSNYGFTLSTNGSVAANNNGVNDISIQFVNPGGGEVSYSNILSNGGQFLITTSGGDQILIGLFVPYYSTQYIAGRPLQITYRGGYIWTFNYGSQGEVDSITDNLGRTISLSWYYAAVLGTSTQYPLAIQTITMPDGTALNYTYESYTGTQGGNGGYARLKAFTRTHGGTVADSASYLYSSSVSPALLTGVVDNAGVQFNTWQYDAYGHVVYESHPNGADAVNVAYSLDPSGLYAYRTVTNALGLQTSYTFETVWGYDPGLISVVGAPTSNCLGTTTTLGYDNNARITSRTDSLGNITQYTYGTDGRVQSRTEAYGTAVQRTTSYTWNDTFGVPTQIVKSGLTSNLTYDATGRLTQRQELDTTTQTSPYSTHGQTRTWTYGYNSAGLLSSVNGPLAGNQILYSYSSNGYRSSTTNALGQVELA